MGPPEGKESRWSDIRAQVISALFVAGILALAGIVVYYLTPVLLIPVPLWSLLGAVSGSLVLSYALLFRMRKVHRLRESPVELLPSSPTDTIQGVDSYAGLTWYTWIAKDSVTGQPNLDRIWVRGPFCPAPCLCELSEIIPTGTLGSVRKVRLECASCNTIHASDQTMEVMTDAVRRRAAAKLRRGKEDDQTGVQRGSVA